MGSSIPAAKALIDSSREPFYVIRKGDVIGVYKNLSDCQAQASKSVLHPSVTVYKGYSLRKETEEYLAARGFRNAVYSIGAADASDELFGDLVPCPFQQPDENTQSILKMSQGQEMETRSSEHPKVADLEPLPDSELSCILEFDGACKGNPGKSGAGVIIRRLDGSVVQGAWRARSDNMSILCDIAKELKETFLTFQINHVLREFNSDADVQANFGCQLAVDEVQELSV